MSPLCAPAGKVTVRLKKLPISAAAAVLLISSNIIETVTAAPSGFKISTSISAVPSASLTVTDVVLKPTKGEFLPRTLEPIKLLVPKAEPSTSPIETSCQTTGKSRKVEPASRLNPVKVFSLTTLVSFPSFPSAVTLIASTMLAVSPVSP